MADLNPIIRMIKQRRIALGLTAHLAEKSWLKHTNWFDFIRATAMGTSLIGIVAPTGERGQA